MSLFGYVFLVLEWNYGVIRFFEIVKTSGKVIKIDVDSEEVSRGRFARIYVKVDITKPLKMQVKNRRG